MPSFRVTMTIGRMLPSVSPDTVAPTAVAAAAELTVVEASDISVVAGEARLTVRFTADDPRAAARIGRHVVEATACSAAVPRWIVTRRVRDRWLPVAR